MLSAHCYLHVQVYDAPKHWTSTFTRHAYFSPDHPRLILLTYCGDAAAACSFPHGNNRSSNGRNYIRTQPHVLRDIEHSAGSARTVYQNLVLSGPSSLQLQTTATPRNMEQVRNVQKAQRNRGRLTRDALYNLHEFAAGSAFIHKIVTHPDLNVVMYSAEVIGMFSDLTSHNSEHPLQTLSYDTTFCLGDFYVSVVLFRHTDFDPAPIIPLAYLLHERKTTETHAEFFRHLHSICPQLSGLPNMIIVTDQERAITQAIHDIFPSLQHFLCWNHVLQDCKRWLHQHGASSQVEVTYYLDSVRSLLSSNSENAYKDALLVAMTKWSKAFSQYFMDSIHAVTERLGAWHLRPLGVDQVTGNQSEAFNTVMKRLQQWKEAPVDSMMLCLFRLTQYYVSEVRRGHHGVGEFILRPGALHKNITACYNDL